MNDHDLIAEGRAKQAALAESPSTDRAFDLAEWAGLNLPALLDRLETAHARIAELEVQRERAFSMHRQELAARTKTRTLLDAARARIAELERENVALRLRVEPLDSPDFEVLLKELGVDMTDPTEVLAEKVVHQRERIAELEAAQRPPLGYVVTFIDLLDPELAYDCRELIEDKADALDALEAVRFNDPSRAQAYRLAEVREVQP